MPPRERADDEHLAREEREGVGLADLHPELEVRRGEGLGLLEVAGHHRLERLVDAHGPPQPRLGKAMCRGSEPGKTARGDRVVGGLDGHEVRRLIRGEREVGVAAAVRGPDCLGGDASSQRAAPGCPKAVEYRGRDLREQGRVAVFGR